MLRQLAFDTLHRLGVVIRVDEESDLLIGRLANVLHAAREVDEDSDAESMVFGALLMIVSVGLDSSYVEQAVRETVQELRS